MPNYNKLIPSILDHGLETLPQHCHLTPGKTLYPYCMMLAAYKYMYFMYFLSGKRLIIYLIFIYLS